MGKFKNAETKPSKPKQESALQLYNQAWERLNSGKSADDRLLKWVDSRLDEMIKERV